VRNFAHWELSHILTRLVGMSLRERKKTATRQALHQAAVRLAIAHGADKITVEAIADEAGVSRRTFSNYFANKEEALLYGDHQRISALIGMVRARPAGERPWEALTEAAREFYRQVGELDPAWVAQTRLLRSHPALLAQQLNTFAAVERELAATVTARMSEPDPSGVRARLAAATFLASLRVALHIWLDAPADTSLEDLVDRALAEAGRGFA
jgi:AcrR family transcriptional regulator